MQQRVPRASVQLRPQEHKQLLREAIKAGDLERTRSLIEAGVEIDQYDVISGDDSPLLLAVKARHPGIIEYLVSQGYDVNQCCWDYDTRRLLFTTTPKQTQIERIVISCAHTMSAKGVHFLIRTGLLPLAKEEGYLRDMQKYEAARELVRNSPKITSRSHLAPGTMV